MESKNEETIEEMKVLANYIKSGGLQRDLSKDSPSARFKKARVKATVTETI
jgi:ketol-acid reductoisomerase